MKTYGAFCHPSRDPEHLFYGEVSADGCSVHALPGPYWQSTAMAGGTPYPTSELKIRCPVAPSKVIAVGRNYHAHAAERGESAPTSPLTWLMSPASLLAHGGGVELPFPGHRVDFEAELGIVIGRRAKNVSVAEAEDYIFGYTTCLDISDRDIQDAEGQFARAKGFDTFTPVGPFVYSGVAADDLSITLHQNGQPRQDARTSAMIFNVREIVSFCSQGATLQSGDLILTGTPAGVGPIRDGRHAGNTHRAVRSAGRAGAQRQLKLVPRPRENHNDTMPALEDITIDRRLLTLPYRIEVTPEGWIRMTPLQAPGLTWEQLATTHPILPEDLGRKIETNAQNQILMSPPPKRPPPRLRLHHSFASERLDERRPTGL